MNLTRSPPMKREARGQAVQALEDVEVGWRRTLDGIAGLAGLEQEKKATAA
jgi:hypothetical protein